MTPRLEYVLDTIHDWTRNADSKAGFIVGFATLALGWLTEDTGDLIHAIGIVPVVGIALLLVCGIMLAAMAVFPKVSLPGKPWSPLFFQDIAGRYAGDDGWSDDTAAYRRDLSESYDDMLAVQIIANARVASRKHGLVKHSFRVVLLAVLLLINMKLTVDI